MPVRVIKEAPEDLYKGFETDPVGIYREAYERGMNLSAWLSRKTKTDDNKSPVDGFGLVLREAGIIVNSDPQSGYWSSKCDVFLNSKANRALFLEFCARQWRKVAFGQVRQVDLIGDSAPGSWERPYVDRDQLEISRQIAPAIPLDRVISGTFPIDGGDYRGFFLTYAAADLRMSRVGEGADLPVVKLASTERSIQLHKYGRAIEASYELLRRMRVDQFAFEQQWVAAQSEVDKLAAFIDVAINGDGNANTAATVHNLTTLDPNATVLVLSAEAWLNGKKQFLNPYMPTTALMQNTVSTQLELLNMGSSNVALAQFPAQFGDIRPINRTADNVEYGWTADAPANQILLLDNRRSPQQLVEIGSDISETENFIIRQTTVITMSEIQGFWVLDPNAARVIDLAA